MLKFKLNILILDAKTETFLLTKTMILSLGLKVNVILKPVKTNNILLINCLSF